ncbi:B12-binding domain-containing radical SAM protein [Streptomyces niveus]|uniref:B12-binding domain-containing radical SAM protein n=1 Tax=Streptomyces niveus TaxID=193462 RepID=UPI0035DB893D
MRICLVVPTNPFDRFFVQVPIDVVLAAGQLRAEGHEVMVWDQRLTDAPTAIPDPELLVIHTAIADRAQCYPLDLVPVRAAADLARQHFPRARTMAVGPHGNQLPGGTLLELEVQHVSVGEADSATVHGVRALASGVRSPVLYGNLPTSPQELLVVGNRPTPYPNLAAGDWALPAYDLIPLERYTAEVIKDGVLHPGPAGVVMAARGCTYGCTFCHLPFGNRMRTHPVDRVIKEVETQQAGGLNHQFFLDYVFGINKAFYGQLCDRLRGQGVGWVGQTRAEIVLKTDVRAWAEAGCEGMWLGAESPSVAGTGVHKRVTEQQIRDAVLKLSDAGIAPFAFVLIGLPDDEACMDDWLVDWAADIPAWFGVNQLFLRPGTSLYDDLAAGLNGGAPPATWEQVRQVTRSYREQYPADLDDQERRLMELPNYLANALTPAG